MLSAFSGGNRPTDPADLPAYFDRMQRAKLRSKAFVAALDMHIDRHNVMQLLEVHFHLMEAKRNDPLMDEPSDATRAVDGFLEELSRVVSGRSADAANKRPTDQFPAGGNRAPRR